jgi:hypothetical protein
LLIRGIEPGLPRVLDKSALSTQQQPAIRDHQSEILDWLHLSADGRAAGAQVKRALDHGEERESLIDDL